MLIPADELRAGVRRLASEVSAAYEDGVVLVAVLKGSVPFLADLVRAMTIDPVVDFLAISSYAAGTGRVRLLKDLDIDVCGRDVVLVEDIVDSGHTVAAITRRMRRLRPASLRLAALLDRPARRAVPVTIDFKGFVIPDRFVIGYGLDYAGLYRELPGIYSLG